MSLRQLVEGDCGGANPLMQLGGQFVRDAARKDEGLVRTQFERSMHPDEQLVNEFMGQVNGPPQSFQMETLLQEMREIERASGGTALQVAPRIIDEVTGQWTKEFATQSGPASHIMHMQPQQQQITHVREFFNDTLQTREPFMFSPQFVGPPPQLAICPSFQQVQFGPSTSSATLQFFDEANAVEQEKTPLSRKLTSANPIEESREDWVHDYNDGIRAQEQAASDYNEKFWQRLQDEWQKLSEQSEHPWLSELTEQYDPYDEYRFAEENPMSQLENPLERGKEYLAKGDIPSAVLCFEVAANLEPENAEIWELLGISQAENEMDPQGIAALKRSLALQPNNKRVLMALAVCYTNESLQSHALKMLTQWLEVHPTYKHLLEQHPELQGDGTAMASSLIHGNRLQEVQNLFLNAVRLNPQNIDPDIQEALGVLYNLSSEFDKAVDCFRAALQVHPQNAKVWNRLGASLANGSRSVEAVEAYQQALQLEPGFIRVRYNVGVCCMNLKAYRQAVEHLLTALNMQANSAVLKELPAATGVASVASSQQQMSESIWSTLKMVVSLMGRNDLQSYIIDRNLNALNEAFQN